MKRLLEKNDPLLRLVAEPILEHEFKSAWLKDLINDMLDIMKEKGAVGIAAPQIGISKRVIAFGTVYTKKRKVEVDIPVIVLINPVLKFLTEEKELGYEGCLNCENLIGMVPRAIELEYSGYDLEGNFIKKYATGLEARILQHEVDHLNGFLFIDRIEDKNSLTTYEELQKEQG